MILQCKHEDQHRDGIEDSTRGTTDSSEGRDIIVRSLVARRINAVIATVELGSRHLTGVSSAVANTALIDLAVAAVTTDLSDLVSRVWGARVVGADLATFSFDAIPKKEIEYMFVNG